MCVKVDEVSYEVMRNKGNVDTIYNSTDMKNKVEADSKSLILIIIRRWE